MKFNIILLLSLLTLFCSTYVSADEPLPVITPQQSGMSVSRLNKIEPVIADALKQELFPGCVILIGRKEGIVYQRAFGKRQLEPTIQEMTTDTVFDLASLTKPLATASSIMMLVERGQIEVDKPVAHYLPDFAVHGKDQLTIKDLLVHQSGLIADNPVSDYLAGRDQSFQNIMNLKLSFPLRTRFQYSDVNFIALGKVVEQVTKKRQDEFTHAEFWKPLGMNNTGYLPADELKSKSAVTEKRGEIWLAGEVHDPRAALLNGVAGHAGLFSTAEDLARYSTMILNQGTLQGKTIFQKETIQLMMKPVEVPGGYTRALGWDHHSSYSSNRGDLFSEQAIGHGGFTGTGIWIDPGLNLYVIFLSNRVHMKTKSNINPLIGRVCTIAAAAVNESE